MALGIMRWNLPSTGGSDAYMKQAKEQWVPTVLRQAGVTEFRAYRQPEEDQIHVMVETEFDSFEHLQAWMDSADYDRLKSELAQFGATGITDQAWDASPVIPDPIRPS
jgi:quinol monooxygenase YgiN